jgi:hypothetical protein
MVPTLPRDPADDTRLGMTRCLTPNIVPRPTSTLVHAIDEIYRFNSFYASYKSLDPVIMALIHTANAAAMSTF